MLHINYLHQRYYIHATSFPLSSLQKLTLSMDAYRLPTPFIRACVEKTTHHRTCCGYRSPSLTSCSLSVYSRGLQLTLRFGILGSRHHLHGLGNLLDVLHRLQAHGDFERISSQHSYSRPFPAPTHLSYMLYLLALRVAIPLTACTPLCLKPCSVDSCFYLQ